MYKRQTTGLDISMNDLATGNHATSTSKLVALDINLDHADADALIAQQTGIDLTLTDGDTGYVGTNTATVGISSTVEDGGFDIVMRSSADTGDHCTIATTANGATTITTVDDDAAAAHFEIAADGDITLDSAGQIKLEPKSGGNILLDGTIAVDAGVVTGVTSLQLLGDTNDTCTIASTTHGATTLTTVDDNAAAAHLTFDIDGDVRGVPMHYRFMGYGQGDGTNYFLGQPFTDAQAPFEHADSSSSDGLTITAGSGTNISELMRSGGHVMIRAGTLKKWTGWGTYNGSDDAFVSLFKWTPVDDDNTDITPVLLDTATIDGEGNDKARSFAETSFTQASVAAGYIIFTQIKTETNNKTVYFNSTLEIELGV